jgi:hypothetical protein
MRNHINDSRPATGKIHARRLPHFVFASLHECIGGPPYGRDYKPAWKPEARNLIKDMAGR